MTCTNPKCNYQGPRWVKGFGGRKACPRCLTFFPLPLKPSLLSGNAKLARSMRKAYRSTDQFKVDQLMAEQSKWQRRQTIATNKLADVRKRIDELLAGLVAPKLPPLNQEEIKEYAREKSEE